MSRNCHYVLIPFDKLPDKPAYTVWHHPWSKERSTYQKTFNAGLLIVRDEDE